MIEKLKTLEIDEETRKKLGKYIDNVREQRQLGFNQLALKSGLNPRTLNEIIKGDSKRTNPFALQKIALALRVDYKDLYKIVGYLSESDFGWKEATLDLSQTIKLMTIPVYASVAAGVGAIPDAEPVDYISVPETSGDVVSIIVRGDSMEPTFYEGDIVVMKKDVAIEVGDIGVFLNKDTGESIVKRLKHTNGTYVLESDNHIFKDRIINKNEFICCGKVISVVKKDLKKRVDPLYEMLESLEPNQRDIIEAVMKGLLEKK